ncbi:recombinase family protein [Bacillus pinisoli]|uniref:recombinase family protein n=1 Tax=Bacillus pinisoli TaxID=2901866 RepID=UPI001FF21D46|nr:recombinase family protein [Bacillus pinisoli]
MEANKKKWAIYERVSTKDQETENRQTPNITEYISRYLPEININDVLKFSEKKSAYRLDKEQREEFSELLDKVRAGEIDGILVSDVDRISRKIEEHIELRALFDELNVDVRITNKNSDYKPPSPQGLIASIIEDGLSKLESDNISVRTKAGLEVKRLKKQYVGGQLPFGYNWVKGENTSMPGKAVVDQIESNIVKKVYNLFEFLPSYSFIANYLNKNYPKIAAKELNEKVKIDWTIPHVKNLLLNPWYCGYHMPLVNVKNITEDQLLSKWEKITFLCDMPIISEEQWIRVWRLIHNNKLLDSRIKTKFTFQGLIKCSCNETLRGRDQRTKNPYGGDPYGKRWYMRKECDHRISEEDAIKEYDKELQIDTINEKIKRVLLYRVREEIILQKSRKTELQKNLNTIQSKLKKLEQVKAKADKLEDLLLPEYRDYSAFLIVKNALEQQFNSISQELDYTCYLLGKWEELEGDFGSKGKWVFDLLEDLKEDLSEEYSRIEVLFLVKEIVLDDQNELHFNFYK